MTRAAASAGAGGIGATRGDIGEPAVVLVCSDLDEAGLVAAQSDGRFRSAEEGLRTDGHRRRVAGLIVRSGVRVDRMLLDQLPNLRFVVRAGSGTDEIDVEELRHRGIPLIRNAEATAATVAELGDIALGALARRIPEASRSLQLGHWSKSQTVGESVSGLVVTVWGAGPIGCAVATRLSRSGVPSSFVRWPSVNAGLPQRTVEAAFATSDVHVLCLPLRAGTRRIFDADVLASVAAKRPYVLNLGRFDLLDFEAAVRSLTSGSLRGVFVDPVDSQHVELVRGSLCGPQPLNLLCTPHLGAQHDKARREVGAWAVATASTLLDGWTGSSRD